MVSRPGFVLLAMTLGAQLLACSAEPEACADSSRLHVGSIEITGTKGSPRVEDFACVQVVEGSLTISDPAVRSLESLGALLQVSGDLKVTGTALKSLHGLEQLAEVGGTVSLSEMDELGSLEGLTGLRRLGALSISHLPKLASLEALAALDAIGGDLTLARLPAIVTFDGLGALAHVGGDLAISENAALTDLDAFRSLRTIDGAFLVTDNRALTSASFRNEDPSRFPSVAGDLRISENPSLETLTGFGVPLEQSTPCGEQSLFTGIVVAHNDGLERLELPDARRANVFIADNDRLQTLTGQGNAHRACEFILSSLPSLTSVSLPGLTVDSLAIWDTGLTALDGLEKAVVSCSLEISKNAALADVSGFSPEGLVHLDISHNPSLASCQVQALVEALPAPSQCAGTRVNEGQRTIWTDGNDDSAICE